MGDLKCVKTLLPFNVTSASTGKAALKQQMPYPSPALPSSEDLFASHAEEVRRYPALQICSLLCRTPQISVCSPLESLGKLEPTSCTPDQPHKSFKSSSSSHHKRLR